MFAKAPTRKVKVYLLLTQLFHMSLLDSADSKRRTRYAQKTQNPEWNQTVIYKNIHLEQVLCLKACVHRQTDRQKKKHMHTRNFRTPCHFAFTALAYRVIASSANSNSVLMCWPCLKCPCATSIQNQVEELTSVVSDSPLLFIQLSVAVPTSTSCLAITALRAKQQCGATSVLGLWQPRIQLFPWSRPPGNLSLCQKCLKSSAELLIVQSLCTTDSYPPTCSYIYTQQPPNLVYNAGCGLDTS